MTVAAIVGSRRDAPKARRAVEWVAGAVRPRTRPSKRASLEEAAVVN